MRRPEFLGTLSASLLAGSLIRCAGEESLTGPVLNLFEYEEEKRFPVSIDEELTLLDDPYRHQRKALGEVLAMNWQD
tara:strand:+ start:646 stop:876 length:231 start_codon:yes stop_codon:yes gene_type:complete